MYDPDRTYTRCTFISAKLKGLTRSAFQCGVERAMKNQVPLIRVRPPVNQHTIGEMELVPSAVGPNEIEQRCRIVKVRTLRRRVESRGGGGPPSSSSGAWRFLRGPGPRVLLGPVRKDKEIKDLQDPSSASASAQDTRKYQPSCASARKPHGRCGSLHPQT